MEPLDVVAFIQQDVARWAPRLGDDMVVVVMQRTHPPGDPRPMV